MHMCKGDQSKVVVDMPKGHVRSLKSVDPSFLAWLNVIVFIGSLYTTLVCQVHACNIDFSHYTLHVTHTCACGHENLHTHCTINAHNHNAHNSK